MKKNFMQGIGFGITSGVITTLGLLVGLNSGTHEKLAVIGGVIVIAIADALSDAFGAHVSQEAKEGHSIRSLWEISYSTFLTKLIVALTFVIPVLIFSLDLAVIIAVIWGMFLLGIFSYIIAKNQKGNILGTIIEHISIGAIVVIISNYIGVFVRAYFG